MFAVLVLVAYVVNFIYALKSNATGGTFGDTFGAANAFFSGGALLMLIYAIILQRNELNLVKEERDDTRQILSGQEDLNTAQKEALDRQAFEQSFFALLSLISEERNQISQRINADGSATFLGNAAHNTSRRLRDGHNIDDLLKATYLDRAASLANLFFVGQEYLQSQLILGHSATMHLQSLRAFVDKNTSRVLIPYAFKYYANPVPVFLRLGCFDYLTVEELTAVKALVPEEFADF